MNDEPPLLSDREALIKDVSDLIVLYHDNDSAAAADSASLARGSSGGKGGIKGRRAYIPRAVMRAELNRLRDSLLATGPADFSDTLRIRRKPVGKSTPSGFLPPVKPKNLF
ncbi:hypothetical protein [Hymenobacter terrenus]|uniref:hypothetical protein n=1 Tax=Hymenobacter terrenus TaxID=1629124 RepID=UPI000A828EE3|nr:hypothetical protein [Hymenobacter terrenus]